MAAELLKKTVRISTGHLKCSGHSLLFLPGGEEGGRLGWTSPKTDGHRSCSMIPDGLVGGLVGHIGKEPTAPYKLYIWESPLGFL